MIKLSPEQVEDALRMANEQDLPNFSKAGTGKTHTALKAIELTKAKQSLVLAPKIALGWWQEQASEFLGADARILKSGSSPLAGDIMITTYDIARNMKARLWEYFSYGNLVLDESQNVCNPDAGRTRAVFGNSCDLVGSLAERFEQVWPMSGTPIQNYANDLFTQVCALHPELFEKHGVTNYDSFCRKFTFTRKKQFHPNMKPVMKISGNVNEILLSRIVYTELDAIHRIEAAGLPPIRTRHMYVPLKLDADMRKLMAEVDKLPLDQIMAAINAPDSIIAKAWRFIGLIKVAEVVPYIGDCVKDGPILVGCWHRDVMTAYCTKLREMGLKVEQVHGGTPDLNRAVFRKMFNNGEIDVLIGQMKAMGTAWNLQEASSHIIVAETHPTPSVIEQFYKRVHRRGQKNHCQLDIVVGDNKLDRALEGVRQRKEASSDKITG